MKRILNLILIGLLANNILFGQINQKISTIDSMINIYTHYYGFCGTVLIEKNGNLILNKGYGFSNYEMNTLDTDSTEYQICSLGKGLTQILIFGLAKEGRINFEDKLYTYLPEIGENIGNSIKLKHLIIHQSGLAEHFFDPTNRKTKIENIKSIKDEKLQFEPGTKENYCNLNYYILDIILERVTGRETYLEIQEKIYNPLGMTGAKFNNAEKMFRNYALPHYVNQVNQGEVFYHVIPKPNDESIIMTVYDLSKWIKAWHLDEFKLGKVSLANEVTKNYGKDYGTFSLGWETNNIKRRYAIGDGAGEGFRSLYLFFPDDSLTIIMLNNSYYFPAVYANWNMPLFDDIVYKSADIMLDREFSLPKLPVGQVLINNIKKGLTVGEIEDAYYRMKLDTNYLVDVKQLNKVGYYYLDNNKLNEAHKIFSININEYPDSWIVYDGIGEYYLRMGNREKALDYLKISLEKNPNKWREERKMNDIRRNNLEILNLSLDNKINAR
jgi:CubicO group peptidase (beta-lactamase class C family)